MDPIDPPGHLSEEARAYLLDPPEPPPSVDLDDHAAVAEFRAAAHAEWLEMNDQIVGPWVHRSGTVAGVPVVRFAADERAFDDPQAIVHLHGGAYFLGSPMTNAAIAVPIAQRTGVQVVSVDYRLAPEHPCPAAVDDAVAVCTALGADHPIVGLYGESAGGGLALATAIALRDAGASLPRRLGLVSPWVDLTCSGDTYRTLAHVDPDFPNPDDPPRWALAYGGTLVAAPEASPLFADLTGLPPTLVQVGGREILLSDSVRLDAALRKAGVRSTLDMWDGLWHVWHLWHHIPEALDALDQLATHLTEDT